MIYKKLSSKSININADLSKNNNIIANNEHEYLKIVLARYKNSDEINSIKKVSGNNGWLENYIMKKRHWVSQNNCKRPLLLTNFLIFRFSYPLEFKDEKIGQKY